MASIGSLGPLSSVGPVDDDGEDARTPWPGEEEEEEDLEMLDVGSSVSGWHNFGPRNAWRRQSDAPSLASGALHMSGASVASGSTLTCTNFIESTNVEIADYVARIYDDPNERRMRRRAKRARRTIGEGPQKRPSWMLLASVAVLGLFGLAVGLLVRSSNVADDLREEISQQAQRGGQVAPTTGDRGGNGGGGGGGGRGGGGGGNNTAATTSYALAKADARARGSWASPAASHSTSVSVVAVLHDTAEDTGVVCADAVCTVQLRATLINWASAPATLERFDGQVTHRAGPQEHVGSIGLTSAPVALPPASVSTLSLTMSTDAHAPIAVALGDCSAAQYHVHSTLIFDTGEAVHVHSGLPCAPRRG